MKNWLEFEKIIFSNWKMILNISKKEFKKEFAGSKLGILWAIIRPLAMIAVFWFVFGKLMNKNNQIEGVPYIAWLVSGYVPWIFISDNIVSGASSIRNSSFLVKKVKFPVEILPSIRLLISFYTFAILLILNFIIFATSGCLFNINLLKLIYAIVATVIFLSALSRLTSTWVVMSVDILHGIGVILQFLFWMAPVMWNTSDIAGMPMVSKIAKINPFYYLVTMFRDAYLGTHEVSLLYSLYFIVITILLFIFGSKVYKKFRPEFDDVL